MSLRGFMSKCLVCMKFDGLRFKAQSLGLGLEGCQALRLQGSVLYTNRFCIQIERIRALFDFYP